MSLEVAAVVVVIVAALLAGLIGAISLLRSDRRKGKEESRRKGIEIFREARTSWDQAQLEIAESVRRAKLQETRAAYGGVDLAAAKVIWPTVEQQIHGALAA